MNSIMKLLVHSFICLIAVSALPAVSSAEVIDDDVSIDSLSYVVISSRRVGRTVKEYTLKAVANNSSSTQYTDVTAALISVPSNVAIIDGQVSLGTVGASANVTSSDEFTIRINVRVPTDLDDLIWRVEGNPPAPPPPGSGGGTGGGSGGGAAQVGIFMKIDGSPEIKGESKSDSHQDWIELLSFSESAMNSAVAGPKGGGGSTGKANFDDVAVSKLVDMSSVPLRLALAQGDIFNEIQIEIIKKCGDNFYAQYAITLTAPMISSISAAGGFEAPTESLTIDYVRIESVYTQVDEGCRLRAPVYYFYDKRGI